MPTYANTVKWALRKLTGSNTISDIDAGIAALADDVDPKLTPFDSGLYAARPTSTAGSPGKAGRKFYATDIGVIYLDHGTGWVPLTEPIGHVSWWAGAGAPGGDSHLEANGQAVSRSTYALLFTIIGTTHGAGDGSTTFNLPDLVGRVAVGRDPSAARIPNNPRVVGQSGGEERHTLTTPEMPSHQHDDAWRVGQEINYSVAATGTYAMAPNTTGVKTGATGGGLPHQNLQPYAVLTPIIRVR